MHLSPTSKLGYLSFKVEKYWSIYSMFVGLAFHGGDADVHGRLCPRVVTEQLHDAWHVLLHEATREFADHLLHFLP